jgi:hypothetical protein
MTVCSSDIFESHSDDISNAERIQFGHFRIKLKTAEWDLL